MELTWSNYSIAMGPTGNVVLEWNVNSPPLQARQEKWGKGGTGEQTVGEGPQEQARLSRASRRHSSCSWLARLPGTTGRSPCWHFPQSHCRGWCSCEKKESVLVGKKTQKKKNTSNNKMTPKLTCWHQCRNLLGWFRGWTWLGRFHPASPCRSSPRLCLPTPKHTNSGQTASQNHHDRDTANTDHHPALQSERWARRSAE